MEDMIRAALERKSEFLTQYWIPNETPDCQHTHIRYWLEDGELKSEYFTPEEL